MSTSQSRPVGFFVLFNCRLVVLAGFFAILLHFHTIRLQTIALIFMVSNLWLSSIYFQHEKRDITPCFQIWVQLYSVEQKHSLTKPVVMHLCLCSVTGWEEERVSSPSILRLIFQGRFLHGNVTLGGKTRITLANTRVVRQLIVHTNSNTQVYQVLHTTNPWQNEEWIIIYYYYYNKRHSV